ncbi:MAG: 7-cyano-7-deazaguanine synthase, partial [Bacteroidia bacterium]|nr:7-cyano-7-deazaguanine synthase [Bacteroidia bacterium]
FDARFSIITPLMFLSKAETWRLADELSGLDLIVRHTHTCYYGRRDRLHDWGYGCGECPACKLRKKGWEEFVSTSRSVAPQNTQSP